MTHTSAMFNKSDHVHISASSSSSLSASVLDRLNALLEPQGVLSINERGTVNGDITTVVPHPEFRYV